MRLSFALSLVLSAISINAKHTNKLHQDLFIENVKPSGLVPATSAQSPVSNANAGHPSQPFQVDVPIVTPPTASCTVLLAQHSFANSYGAPFIGAYTPPKGKCGSENWSKVVLNWTVSSIGGQYDRIAFIGLGATEIFRTSTAEPNNKGIHWTQLKDVTRFSSLWAKPSTIVIDLGNIISGRLNASYDVSMSATFYASTKKYPVPDGTPDLVIPVTTQNASQSPALSVPNAASALVTIPQNTVRAFIELRASGNGAEEFWYTNAPTDYASNAGTAPLGPFKEFTATVDGKLVSAIVPFPVIFTGGISPGLWQPIVSIDAFNLLSETIDITAFLPLLVDGKAHNISLNVPNGNQNWFVTANLQLYLDKKIKQTTGKILEYSIDPPTLNNMATQKGKIASDNSTANFTFTAHRRIRVKTQFSNNPVTLKKGNVNYESTYGYNYKNKQTYLNNSDIQYVTQSTTSNAKSIIKDGKKTTTVLNIVADYPIHLNTTAIFNADQSLMYYAQVDHSLTTSAQGTALPPGVQVKKLSTKQNGTSTFFLPNTPNTGVTLLSGIQHQTYDYQGSGELSCKKYTRDVVGDLRNVTYDHVLNACGTTSKHIHTHH